uniref:Golgi-associated, gamma adaptin ear containing, ARF binding protein 1 n=1 Tax=Neogobius melanostomus TaxID=47308 RepID=A0A8C6SD76_9GOBI
MAAPPPDEAHDAAKLQSRINTATNPQNKETDWDSITGFCDQLNNEPEGPQHATRLLAHKIQSPQEWEAMQALTVLETCIKNCGKKFHTEVGKFRFLNELIKVVSPKYLGSRAAEPVKKKVIEIMYSWTIMLPDEAKISEAYHMLKKQGIVKQDPVLPDDKPLPPPPPRALSQLLKSTHPEDLRAANKLIKEMVQEDQKRVEKVSKRVNAIQEVNESVSLLSQLLEGYSKESSSQSNQELIKELFQRCEKMRPTLFRLASDTEDSDEALGDILEANDRLTQVINTYRQLVKGEVIINKDDVTQSQEVNSNSALLDLMGINPLAESEPSNTEPFSLETPTQNMSISLLDDELMSLGFSQIMFLCPSCVSSDFMQIAENSSPIPAAVLLPSVAQKELTPVEGSRAPAKALDDLDILGKTLLEHSLPPESQQVKWDKLQTANKMSLRDLQSMSNSTTFPGTGPASSTAARLDQPIHNSASDRPSIQAIINPQQTISLSEVIVPLETIRPSTLLPVTVMDKHSLRALFTFARDCPPSRPDVLVVIISMLSSAPVPITNIRFQAAVPKVSEATAPTATELPPFNPILPPAAITQILLLANPQKEKVRLRYKLTFNVADKFYDVSGDVDQFPPPSTWGNL